MSSQFDDFDLDVRFHADPFAQGMSLAPFPSSPAVCQVVVQTVLGCEPAPAKTADVACEIQIQPTIVAHTCEQTCAHTCAGQTCQNTCDPAVCGVTNPAACDTNTCNLGCETNTCPDVTCGCNTNETCDHRKCDGPGITIPPCEDVSADNDTCDACQPQTVGCGGADTDQCVRTSDC